MLAVTKLITKLMVHYNRSIIQLYILKDNVIILLANTVHMISKQLYSFGFIVYKIAESISHLLVSSQDCPITEYAASSHDYKQNFKTNESELYSTTVPVQALSKVYDAACFQYALECDEYQSFVKKFLWCLWNFALNYSCNWPKRYWIQQYICGQKVRNLHILLVTSRNRKSKFKTTPW